MAAARGPVWISHHHVRMDYRLSLIECNVTAHPDHFALTLDGNLLVHFPLGIEPRQRCSIHGSNRGKVCTRNVILLRKLLQSGKSLVALVKDDRILLRLFSTTKQLNLHPGGCAPWNGFRRSDIVPCRLLRMPQHCGDPDPQQYVIQSMYFDHRSPLLCFRGSGFFLQQIRDHTRRIQLTPGVPFQSIMLTRFQGFPMRFICNSPCLSITSSAAGYKTPVLLLLSVSFTSNSPAVKL